MFFFFCCNLSASGLKVVGHFWVICKCLLCFFPVHIQWFVFCICLGCSFLCGVQIKLCLDTVVTDDVAFSKSGYKDIRICHFEMGAKSLWNNVWRSSEYG